MYYCAERFKVKGLKVPFPGGLPPPSGRTRADSPCPTADLTDPPWSGRVKQTRPALQPNGSQHGLHYCNCAEVRLV